MSKSDHLYNSIEESVPVCLFYVSVYHFKRNMNNLNPTQTGESGKTQQKLCKECMMKILTDIDKLIVKMIHYSV